MKKEVPFLIGVGLIVLAAIGVIALSYSTQNPSSSSLLPLQTNQPTGSSWPEYINSQFGFQFQYPDTSSIIETSTDYVKIKDGALYISASVDVSAHLDTDPPTFAQKTYTESDFDQYAQDTSGSVIMLNGQKVIRVVSMDNMSGGDIFEYIFQANGKRAHLLFAPYNSNYDATIQRVAGSFSL